MGSAWAAVNRSISSSGRAGADRYAPRPTSSLLGTASVDFFSSSRRAGEMVRKSIPASDFISPTYGIISQGHSKILNLAYISERSTHDDGLVVVLLVVIIDLLHGLDTGIIIALVGLSSVFLIPIENLQSSMNEKETRASWLTYAADKR